jgi:hypothetical protein
VNDIHQKESYPNQWHLTAFADAPAASQQFITVLLPHRPGAEAALPEVRLLDGKRCRAVELRTKSARHIVMLRQAGEGGAMEAGGVNSEAKVFAAGFNPEGASAGSLAVP